MQEPASGAGNSSSFPSKVGPCETSTSRAHVFILLQCLTFLKSGGPSFKSLCSSKLRFVCQQTELAEAIPPRAAFR